MNVEVEDAQAFHQLFIDRLKELHREESEVVEFSWMYVKKKCIFNFFFQSVQILYFIFQCIFQGVDLHVDVHFFGTNGYANGLSYMAFARRCLMKLVSYFFNDKNDN